jgi:hypothetical protein
MESSEAQKYHGEGLAKALLAAASTVQRKFARDNPGYMLGLSPLRTVQRQVELWNGNLSVRNAATALAKAMLEELSNEKYPMPPYSRSVDAFTPMLQDVKVHPEPTTAAPGTSDHGQLRAVDFAVFGAATSLQVRSPQPSRPFGRSRAGSKSSRQRRGIRA